MRLVSGAIFQAVTRNELASPFVLGVSSGAGFAVLATLVVFSGLAPFLPLIAALGGSLAFLIVYTIAWKDGTSPVRLVLAGVIVNMVFQSLQQGLFFFADDLGIVQTAIAWITGSLTGTGWDEVRIAILPAVVSIVVAIAGSRQLNVLTLGENTARDDIEDIEQIGPFFGNSIFSRDYEWHEDYEYLTLYEAFEKLSEVFQEPERYAAFSDLHDEFQSAVDDVVPPAADRPAVAIVWANGDGTFLPYLIDEGTSFKQWRDLGVDDALAETDVEDFHSGRGSVDYETLLDIDPDVILCRGKEASSAAEFQETIVAEMEADAAGSDLTAVKNGDVYRGGPLYQGPITNLVVTQRGAEQLYDVDEQLFDPQEVSDIVNGDF